MRKRMSKMIDLRNVNELSLEDLKELVKREENRSKSICHGGHMCLRVWTKDYHCWIEDEQGKLVNETRVMWEPRDPREFWEIKQLRFLRDAIDRAILHMSYEHNALNKGKRK